MRQPSVTTCASRRVPNSSMFNSSSRTRPLKLSTNGFSHGDARFDVAGGRAVQTAPVAQRPGDELGPVVHPQMRRRAPLGDERVDDRDDIVGSAVASDAHGQRLAGVLVDDVAQLDPAAVGGLVELEVNRPHMIRSGRPQQRPAARRPGSFAFARAPAGAGPRRATTAGCASC